MQLKVLPFRCLGLGANKLYIKTIVLSLVAVVFVALVQIQNVDSQQRDVYSKELTLTVEDTDENQQPFESPKVAMLFLSRGEIHNEPIWRVFFERSAEISFRHEPPLRSFVSFVETSALYSEIHSKSRALRQLESLVDLDNCEKEPTYIHEEVERLLSDLGPSETVSVISNQTLFSVYTHPTKDYFFAEDSIFHGTELQDRMDTRDAWASFKLIQAEVKLLRAALSNPLNQKFVLLSESCIPIHRPEVIYLQLLAEKKSRLNACYPFSDKVEINRWHDGMTTPFLDKSKWRKSSQWFTLKRSHAELIVKETHVKERFDSYCKSKGDVKCVPDEHYIPTSLAVYGLDNETDCIGRTTSTIWYPGRSHPATYGDKTISPLLLRKLRHLGSCEVGKSQSSAAMFFSRSNKGTRCFIFNETEFTYSKPLDQDDWVVASGYEQMGYQCRLFARKFPAPAVKKTLKAALACSGGALGYWC